MQKIKDDDKVNQDIIDEILAILFLISLPCALIGWFAVTTTELLPISYWYITLTLTIIGVKIAFLKDDERWDGKGSLFWFTAKIKAEYYLIAGMIIGDILFANALYNIIAPKADAIASFIKANGQYPLIFFGVVGLFIIYIKLNSLKYLPSDKQPHRNDKRFGARKYFKKNGKMHWRRL